MLNTCFSLWEPRIFVSGKQGVPTCLVPNNNPRQSLMSFHTKQYFTHSHNSVLKELSVPLEEAYGWEHKPNFLRTSPPYAFTLC